MPSLTPKLQAACGEITASLLSFQGPTKGQVRAEIRRVCAKHGLERIPGNAEILAAASGAQYGQLRRVLLKKPAKTASGVAIVALMPMPYACPHGRCTYCPGGKESNTPNSYTGSEPATKSAIQSGYDPKLQITEKIDRLVAFGHDPSKTELVIVGGTFLFMPERYRENFVKSCYDALNGADSASLNEAKAQNERAKIRNVGFTVETKPDYCKKDHVDAMLEYGMTRVEIGVQSLQESVYRRVNRGHTYGDVTESFRVAKDAGYKIVAHMMPGLPGSTPDQDVKDFGRLFSDPALKPDMLKIYPCLVTKGTPLYEEYKQGRYEPYSDGQMVDVLTEAKKLVPKWVRIMRVHREIPPSEIVAGPKSGNLRQLVLENLAKQGHLCACIRCREASGPPEGRLDITRTDYESSGGTEAFLAFEDTAGSVYGFLRLRDPGPAPHRPEVPGSCIVRELHVYGRSLGLGEHEEGAIQHAGLGRRLMARAERIAKGEFGAKRLLVISAVGTREYYRALGYSLYGPYMSKELA